MNPLIILLIFYFVTGGHFDANASDKLPYYIASDLDDQSVIIQSLDHTDGSYHLITHGQPGKLLVEGQWLAGDALFQFISSILPSQTNRLLIYGCDFSAFQGQETVRMLEHRLGIPVFSSDNVTGIDGDWLLHRGIQVVDVTINGFTSNLQCEDHFRVRPADMNINNENFNGVHRGPVDLSNRFGLPFGSVQIEVNNAYAREYENGNLGFTIEDNTETDFRFTGTVPVRVKVSHGGRIRKGVKDGFRHRDGDQFTFLNTSLPKGLDARHNINQNRYFVLNETEERIDYDGLFEWLSDEPIKRVWVFTTNDFFDDDNFNNLFFITVYPDFCEVHKELSPSNSCAGENQLQLNSSLIETYECLTYQWAGPNNYNTNELNPIINTSDQNVDYSGRYTFAINWVDELCINASTDVVLPACSTLDIEEVQLSVANEAQGRFLSWEILSENEALSVVVERSLDGIHYNSIQQYGRDFHQGQAKSKFAFVDQETLFAKKLYYRIVVMDQAEHMVLSNVVQVAPEDLSLKLFPNPVVDQVRIENIHTNATSVELYNTLGQRVQQWSKPVNVPFLDIDLTHLPMGIYYIKANQQHILLTKK